MESGDTGDYGGGVGSNLQQQQRWETSSSVYWVSCVTPVPSLAVTDVLLARDEPWELCEVGGP